jgi:hypothetical protein
MALLIYRYAQSVITYYRHLKFLFKITRLNAILNVFYITNFFTVIHLLTVRTRPTAFRIVQKRTKIKT